MLSEFRLDKFPVAAASRFIFLVPKPNFARQTVRFFAWEPSAQEREAE